jgi:FKBP-type peptidyl-prolyl cis-trans isomerase 2
MADEKIKKNDFIEIEFTGKIKDSNEIFDTNIKEDAKKANFDLKEESLKPFVLAIGQGMLVKGLDEKLEGKEIGEYVIELNQEEAFGKRNPSLVRMLPLRIFIEQKIYPQKGMQLALDGMLTKIVSVTGGRVLADFNNPLAGKAVIYEIKILRKIEKQEEKINALQDFFFKKIFPFSVNEKDKKIIFSLRKEEQSFAPLAKFYEKSFKESLGLEVEMKIEE